MNVTRRHLSVLALSLALLLLPTDPAGAGLGEKARTTKNDDHAVQPYDVAVGSDGLIYAVDHSEHDIDVFGPSGTVFGSGVLAYKHVTSFAASGSTEGNLFFPQGIAAGEGSIYVADTANTRVSQFSNNGGHIRSWGESGGIVDGQFLEPSRIALDTAGNVYVSDGRRNDIQKFTSDGSFLMGFKTETPDGPIAKAGGVAIAPDGSIYVTDEIGDRVVKYDAAGNFQSELEGGDLRNPVDVAIDSQGTVYVVCSHSENQTVQVFDPSGTFKFAFGRGTFNFPKGLGIDAKTGDVWVANTSDTTLWGYGRLKPDVEIDHSRHASQFERKRLVYFFEGFNQAVPCEVSADGTMTVPVRKDAEVVDIDGTFTLTKRNSQQTLGLRRSEARIAEDAVDRGRAVRIKVSFKLKCPDSEPVTKRLIYSIRA